MVGKNRNRPTGCGCWNRNNRGPRLQLRLWANNCYRNRLYTPTAFMSLNVISRTKILDVDLLLLLLFILKKEKKKGYSRITTEYLYGLTIKSTIFRLLTKCLIHHAFVLNSYHTRILAFLVHVAIIVCLLHL
jgi:hypothetical protein